MMAFVRRNTLAADVEEKEESEKKRNKEKLNAINVPKRKLKTKLRVLNEDIQELLQK